MQNPQIQPQAPRYQKPDEDILVLQRSIIFKQCRAWQGINQSYQNLQQLVQNHGCFIPRSHAETNFAYKQIIPYLLFMFENKLFVMQRKQTAGEQRLANKFSLGIGGHIRHTDIINNNLLDWARREFYEEVDYQGNQIISTLGVLNDDSNDVGKVHLGIILLIQANSDKISIRDEHKSGIMLTKEECQALYPQMEIWSQICFDFLIEQKIFI